MRSGAEAGRFARSRLLGLPCIALTQLTPAASTRLLHVHVLARCYIATRCQGVLTASSAIG
jgi:hypothetical protein